MSSVRKLYGVFERSDGRIRMMTLLGVSGLVAALAVFMMLPAIADIGEPEGPPSAAPDQVQPVLVAYGGGSGACAEFGDAGLLELHINNPGSAIYEGPDGTKVQLTVNPSDTLFSYVFLDDDGSTESTSIGAFDVIVNGGAQNTWYDNNGEVGGLGKVLTSDDALHAPTKGGTYFKLSHINICYGELPYADLSVTKAAKSSSADVGDVVEFEITVKNNGPATAENVVVTDLLPVTEDDPALPLMSLADDPRNSAWSPNADGQPSQTIASIAPGEENKVVLSIFLEIESAAAGRDDVQNGVSVSADQEDPIGGDNEDQSEPVLDVSADVSGVVYHDRDVDGEQDDSKEEGLNGRKVAAFDSDGFVASAVTATAEVGGVSVDGFYKIADLPPGEYKICEVNNSIGLPTDGTGFVWAWTQSEPSGDVFCTDDGTATGTPFQVDGVNVLLAGYAVTVDGPKEGLNFGNHIQVAITCDTDVTLILGGSGTDDDPLSTITIPGGTPSCSGGNTWTTTYDLGRSDQDGDPWSQFVVFGGLETNDPRVMDMVIVWDAEDASYVNGDLVVPTTEISLALPADPQNLDDIVLCGSLVGGEPTTSTPVCLESRTIAEGGDLFYVNDQNEIVGQIQVTDTIKFLGDPGYFR